MSNFPAGFTDVVTVRGVPIVLTNPGNVLWVNNSSVLPDRGIGGSDGNKGSYLQPFSTIDKAINIGKASRGDIIFCMPGHAETIPLSTTIGFDKAGIAIIGLGHGTLRPTLTMSAVASSLVFSAANQIFQNFLIKTEHDNTIVLEVTGSNSQFVDIEFQARTAATARQWVNCIDIGGASANDCDNTVVSGCRFNSPDVGATDAIKLSEVSDGVIIENCYANGEFSVAPVHNPTGKVCTNLTVSNCSLKNVTTGQLALELVSACTGFLINNRYATDIAGAVGGVDPGACNSFECFGTDAVDVSGLISPVVAS